MPKTVMIVEDNELNMKLFHDLLEAHGYQIVGTRNGIEALDLVTPVHHPSRVHRSSFMPSVPAVSPARAPAPLFLAATAASCGCRFVLPNKDSIDGEIHRTSAGPIQEPVALTNCGIEKIAPGSRGKGDRTPRRRLLNEGFHSASAKRTLIM